MVQCARPGARTGVGAPVPGRQGRLAEAAALGPGPRCPRPDAGVLRSACQPGFVAAGRSVRAGDQEPLRPGVLDRGPRLRDRRGRDRAARRQVSPSQGARADAPADPRQHAPGDRLDDRARRHPRCRHGADGGDHLGSGAQAAGGRAPHHRPGPSVVVGVRLHGRRHEDHVRHQRAHHRRRRHGDPRRPAGVPGSRVGGRTDRRHEGAGRLRRDPLVLDPAARRQAGRGPRIGRTTS